MEPMALIEDIHTDMEEQDDEGETKSLDLTDLGSRFVMPSKTGRRRRKYKRREPNDPRSLVARRGPQGPRRKSSVIWQFFARDQGDRNVVMCMVSGCGTQVGCSGNTTNCIDHLKRHHNRLLMAVRAGTAVGPIPVMGSKMKYSDSITVINDTTGQFLDIAINSINPAAEKAEEVEPDLTAAHPGYQLDSSGGGGGSSATTSTNTTIATIAVGEGAAASTGANDRKPAAVAAAASGSDTGGTPVRRRQHMRRKRSMVWRFFMRAIDEDEIAVCHVKDCEQRVTCKGGNTSSCLDHLRRHHQRLYLRALREHKEQMAIDDASPVTFDLVHTDVSPAPASNGGGNDGSDDYYIEDAYVEEEEEEEEEAPLDRSHTTSFPPQSQQQQQAQQNPNYQHRQDRIDFGAHRAFVHYVAEQLRVLTPAKQKRLKLLFQKAIIEVEEEDMADDDPLH